MSDVINSIFGRPKNETPGSGEYGYQPVAAEPVTAEEPAGDTGTAVEVEETDSSPEAAAATETTEDDSVDGDEDSTEDATEDAEDAEAAETETAEDDSADNEAEDESGEGTGEAVAEADTDVDEAADQAPVAAEEPAEAPAAEADETSARPAAATRGATTVADAVVTKVVTGVASKTEGVHDLAGALTVVVDGEVATISVPLVIEFGHAVKPLAERIRVDVIDAVERLLGLEVDNLDVHIADIHLGD